MYFSMEEALAWFRVVVGGVVMPQALPGKIFEVFANPRLQEPSFVTLVAERATSTLVLF